MQIPLFPTLDETNLRTGAQELAQRDAELGFVLDQYGYPPLWRRAPTFSTLVHIILEQQVSLASANAAFARLQTLLEQSVTPERVLSLSDESLREAGFSRQKILYTRYLAETLLSGRLDLDQMAHLPDETVKEQLKQLKGIGDWTADIYLSECLMRTDILPKGDIAMLEAFKVLKKLDQRPDHDAFVAGTAHWRPWRSVGTRMLWHFYLSERARKSNKS